MERKRAKRAWGLGSFGRLKISWHWCVWRNWSEFWRFLAEPWRFMGESCIWKCKCVRKKQCHEIMKYHQNICPKTQKSIKMDKNDARATKTSPQDRKKSEKGSSVTKVWAPSESLKSAKVGKKGVSKIDVFFTPLLEPTFPHFRLPQAPQKQPKWAQNRSWDWQSSFLARMHIWPPVPWKT